MTVRSTPSTFLIRSSVSSRSRVSSAITCSIALASPATVCAETTAGSFFTTRLIASPGMRPSQYRSTNASVCQPKAAGSTTAV